MSSKSFQPNTQTQFKYFTNLKAETEANILCHNPTLEVFSGASLDDNFHYSSYSFNNQDWGASCYRQMHQGCKEKLKIFLLFVH